MGFLRKLPGSWRARLALLAPRLHVARPITDPASAYDVAYFERFYARVDPWRVARNPDERAKYDLTLDLCGGGPFDSALEIGCGEGWFTELLAPRCRSLLAVDISSRAIRRTRDRLSHHPNVRAIAMTLPASWPPGHFDLIVASDVLYFWPTRDLERIAPRLAEALTPGGRMVAIHYTAPIYAVNDGTTVHDVLSHTLTISHVQSESRDIGVGRPYRIDVWERGDGTAPARGWVAVPMGAPESADEVSLVR